MKKPVAVLFLLFPLWLGAQVLFVVDTLPGYTPGDAHLYIAGTFNDWNPGAPNYMLQKDTAGRWFITLPQQTEGTTVEYKFTLGSWDKVEKGPSGEEIENRRFTYGNGDTVHHRIYNWSNGNSGGSTAAENVHIVSDSFYMPQLNRYRRIWIYLPPGYDTSNIRYPVFYMHDGQNLFDARTSFAGEWEIDETLNQLAGTGKRVPIVVGIDNGGTLRTEELTPWPNAQYGGGKGALYADFIVNTLKPYVDEHYRTLPGRENTAVGGSSLGGLISHYMALKYQDRFAKALLFSPSFWFSDSVWIFTRTHPKRQPEKIYLLCGSEEGAEMVNDMNAMKDSLSACGFSPSELNAKVVAGGHHNEALWSSSFKAAYLWLFDDYVNGIVPVREERAAEVYPNPVSGVLHISQPVPHAGQKDTLIITDINGRVVLEQNHLQSPEIKVCGLTPGIYFLEIRTKKAIYKTRFFKN